ncbi:MAG: hypothetical protein AB2421_16610, partial [Thermotaleaceae bacterium]
MPIPVLWRIILFILIPSTTTIVLYIEIDQAFRKFKKYRKITNYVPEKLLKDIVKPKDEEVIISYESGAKGVLLKVTSISRELLSDNEYDHHADVWTQINGILHENDVVWEEITDWMEPKKQARVQVMEKQFKERFKDNPKMLEKAM